MTRGKLNTARSDRSNDIFEVEEGTKDTKCVYMEVELKLVQLYHGI